MASQPRLRPKGGPAGAVRSRIEIVNRSGFPVRRTPLMRAARAVLSGERVRMRLSIALMGDREIASLNRRHLSHAGTTDVISFPMGEDNGVTLGDLAICVPEVRRNARRFDHPLHAELAFCVAHGILHLVGYDDALETGRRRMHARQRQLLAPLGLAPRA